MSEKNEKNKSSGSVAGICISPKRGTEKKPIESVNLLEDWGLEGDAHAGKWHRQVSLLSKEKVEEFNEKGGQADIGSFGENILVEGINPAILPVQTRLQIGQAVVEITQIGKECHTHCTIYQRVNDCIMPREGTFAKVIQSGLVKTGDKISILAHEKKKQAAVIVCSDKGSKKEREDLSGPEARDILEQAGYEVAEVLVIPDVQAIIEKELKRLADQRQVCLIVTSGGTGFSPRDVTPEATMNVMTRNAPGIAEAIRMESLKITNRAMLSRGMSVIRNKTLIINLPGSPKGVRESLEICLPAVGHGIDILLEQDGECAR